MLKHQNITIWTQFCHEKRDIIRIYVFPLDDNFVFGDIFFFWVIFFLPKATKKNTHPNSPKRKKYSPTNEVTHPTETPLYLRYDGFMPPTSMIFLVTTQKNYTLKVSKIWTLSNSVSVLREHFKMVLPLSSRGFKINFSR